MLGNFVNRITRFCAARFGEAVPGEGRYGEAEEKLAADLDGKIKSYTDNLAAMEFRKAFADLRAIWVAGNEYLQLAAPWTKIKEDKVGAAASVRAGLNLIILFAALSAPVIPFTAEKMFAIFGLDPKEAGRWPTSAKAALEFLKPGAAFTPPDVLFKKIEDEQVAEWRERFGAE
ncbi:MAG TPA: class I tRNA ligase family protein [Parvularculaceae bacterium]|nr:class I tRNA ligase family protein [Parvularculaceae bacterium]